MLRLTRRQLRKQLPPFDPVVDDFEIEPERLADAERDGRDEVAEDAQSDERMFTGVERAILFAGVKVKSGETIYSGRISP